MPVEPKEPKEKTSAAMTEMLAEMERIRARFFALKDGFSKLTADNMDRRMYMFQAEMLTEIACSMKMCEFQLKRIGLVSWEELSLHASIWFQHHQD